MEINRQPRDVCLPVESVQKLYAHMVRIQQECDRLRPLVEMALGVGDVPHSRIECMDRGELLVRLNADRESKGILGSARYLKNRSTEQLRTMYRQTTKPEDYRVGRKWKVKRD
jgi:hypothetical protein